MRFRLVAAALTAILVQPAIVSGSYLSDRYEQATYEQALERIKTQADRHVMVYFGMTTGCPPCNYTKNMLNTAPALLERYRPHYLIVQIDIRNPARDADKAVIAQYKARWAPTLVFLDHSGKQVMRLPQGFNNEKEAILLDEYVSQRLYRKTDFKAYLAANFDRDGARVVPETKAVKAAPAYARPRLRDVLAQNHERMPAEELRRNLPDMLLHKETELWSHTLKLGPDGKLSATGSRKDGTDTTSGAGTWDVSADGKLCVDMKWRRVEEQWCRYVYRVGEEFFGVNEIRDNGVTYPFTLEPLADRPRQ